MDYQTARAKQKIEQILISPFVLLGRIIGTFYKEKNASGIYIICSRYDAGGSVKVNADIAELVADRSPLAIFTKHSKDGKFLDLFNKPGVRMLDIANYIDNKLFHFVNVIWRGILITWINKHKAPVVVGGEAMYFYKLLPFLKKSVKTIELVHLGTWMNYTQSFIPFIDKRVFSTTKVLQDYQEQYKQNNIYEQYKSQFQFVENYVDIPEYKETGNTDIKVVFIGRNSPQKRVNLIVQIAQKVTASNPNIHFTLVGDLEEFRESESDLIQILTNVSTKEQLAALYKTHDVLLLTSLFEGLPIVVMDMMAYGRIVISTAVDGIPDNIKDQFSGLLIHEVTDEEKVVAEGSRIILELNNNKTLEKEISKNAYQHAQVNFGYEQFKKKYVDLITQ